MIVLFQSKLLEQISIILHFFLIGNKKSIKLLDDWFQELGKKEIPNKRAILISGKSGIGKSLLAEIMYKKHNYKIYEFNSSDVRSCKSLKESLDKD